MNAILFSVLLAQGWHSVVVDEGSYISFPVYGFMIDENGYPVIVYEPELHERKFVRWNGTEWNTVYLLRQESDYFWGGQFCLDSRGWLHWGVDTFQSEVRILDYYYDGVAWDSLYYIDTLTAYSGLGVGLVLDSLDQPHFFHPGDMDYSTNYIRKDGASWLKDTICRESTTFYWFHWYHRACMGPGGRPRFIYFMGMEILMYSWQNELGWGKETVDDLDGQGDFAMSNSWLYCDSQGNPYVLYMPYYYGQGYRGKFAWRDSSGVWHREYMDTLGFIYGLFAVDTSGTIHIPFADSTGIYHYTRHLPDTAWFKGERIDTFTDVGRMRMAMDKDGYFHLVFLANSWKKLVYATTRPGVGISEPPQEPKPSLVLIPASHGFWITGYSGQAQIYDPAGRLILSKEIKGKTLISPLRPGVYFVMAGKEKARVAVR